MNLNFVRSWFAHHFITPWGRSGDGYQFTSDWFCQAEELWRELFAEYKDRPGVKYLEIGVYEGRSLIWMLENILTHPRSRATAVDIFNPPFAARLRENLRKSKQGRKVRLLSGYSENVLRKLPAAQFDIIYIDGAHDGRSVFIDAVNSWHLLKPGGVVVFDDYLFHEDNWPKDLTPKPVIDEFVASFRCELTVVHRGNQLILRKRLDRSWRNHSESRVGAYAYDWYQSRLNFVGRGRWIWWRSRRYPVELNAREQALLEKYFLSAQNGADSFQIPPTFESPDELSLLAKRLGVRVEQTNEGGH